MPLQASTGGLLPSTIELEAPCLSGKDQCVPSPAFETVGSALTRSCLLLFEERPAARRWWIIRSSLFTVIYVMVLWLIKGQK
jgi:hypothetical protein